MTSPSTSFDVVVVGTGIAGLAAALALARRQVRVALLGPRAELPAALADRYDPRVYAISPASRQLLADLGAWGAVPSLRATTVEAMDVYGDLGARLQLQAWQAGQADLATIVESTELERALRNALQVFGVPWHVGRFAGLTRRASANDVELLLDDGERMVCRLAVAADGAQSPLRHAAGFTVYQRDYPATGLVAHLNAELPHQGSALQWFMPDGILALLPMPATAAGPQVSMVWSLKRDQADALRALPEPDRSQTLETRLAEITQGRLGHLTVRSSLHGFDLQLQQATPLAMRGVALLGDAAHVVHPLAGQGLNLGLGDVAALAQAVGERESWRQPGDDRVLRRYQRARAESLAAMRLATDGLYHLFDVPLPPLAWLRNTGLQWLNHVPLAKRLLIRQASLF